MLFLYLIITGVLLVLISIKINSNNLFGARESLDIHKLYVEFDAKSVDVNNFKEALTMLSKLYSMPIEKFRPSDHFDDDLSKIDSFLLGQASEKLNEIIETSNVVSIRDFVIEYDKINKRSSDISSELSRNHVA